MGGRFWRGFSQTEAYQQVKQVALSSEGGVACAREKTRTTAWSLKYAGVAPEMRSFIMIFGFFLASEL
jgi:hypothetical protein